jgi:hypothetical protein
MGSNKLTGLTPGSASGEAVEYDQLHAEAHTVASHSDTTATGTELETLTDTSDADALHAHTNHGVTHNDTHAAAKHTASNIIPDANQAYTGDLAVTGAITGTTIGGITEANLIDKSAAETISGKWVFSDYITLGEIGAPAGNPAANTGWLYVKDDAGTSGLYFEADDGTVTDLLAGGGGGAHAILDGATHRRTRSPVALLSMGTALPSGTNSLSARPTLFSGLTARMSLGRLFPDSQASLTLAVRSALTLTRPLLT